MGRLTLPKGRSPSPDLPNRPSDTTYSDSVASRWLCTAVLVGGVFVRPSLQRFEICRAFCWHLGQTILEFLRQGMLLSALLGCICDVFVIEPARVRAQGVDLCEDVFVLICLGLFSCSVVGALDVLLLLHNWPWSFHTSSQCDEASLYQGLTQNSCETTLRVADTTTHGLNTAH